MPDDGTVGELKCETRRNILLKTHKTRQCNILDDISWWPPLGSLAEAEVPSLADHSKVNNHGFISASFGLPRCLLE